MKFYEIVKQVIAALREEGKVSYRALKREFALDDDYLEDLKAELIDIQEVAADKDGKMLVWRGEEGSGETEKRRNGEPKTSSQLLTPKPRPPSSYTPAHLAERILAEQAAMKARGSRDGERKIITALFADLKGSTALIEGLDPEEARAIIDPALQLMMDAVHRYEGYVAQALGDGIFALFGAPIAHEDHPQRALYAALRMQDEMRSYGDQVRLKHGVPLHMRVGVNTGEVVVRSIRKDDLHTDYVPVGHSTNLAARMEQMATPGSIVISEYTRKLTEGYFELKALGAAAIKGVEEPLNVYEVLGAGPLRTRFQVTARRGLTRFVGRQSELAQLQQALDQAKSGHGQIVGVMGEAGLGKSRLFYEFKLTSRGGCLVLEAFAVSHGKASPYLPLIELLKDYFEIEASDDDRKRREKVTGKVLTLDHSLEDTLPYLFALLGIEEQPSSLAQMDPQIRRRRTFEALKKLFLRESLNQPLVLLVEDLHWIDSETQGFLDILSESVASAQLLLLVNYRPEYRHEWGQKTYCTQLRLAPFGRAEAEEFLDVLLGNAVGAGLVPVHAEGAHQGTPLQNLKQLILEKTDGTPFFMEEVVQTLVEEGALSGARGQYRLEMIPTALQLPPTVQGVLAARIDRLTAEEKALLQQLAVIGRQFPLSLAKEVVQQSEGELYRLLSSLQAKEFLYEQPAFPESEYLFKHALTQDVACGTVLQEQRKTLHEKIARAMEVLYKENLDEHYSELAHHYQLSGNTEKAVEYLGLAGQQALRQSANAEAIRHLTTALELLKRIPNSSQRVQNELTLLIALGPALYAIKGPGVPEVEQVYTRAQTLCQQQGQTPHLFPVLRGLYTFHISHGAFRTAHALGEQFLRLAQRLQDPTFLPEAHFVVGQTHFFFGDFRAAQPYYEQVLACYDPAQHGVQAFLYGQDSGVFCRAEGALSLWCQGYSDQAQQWSQVGLTLARDLAHPMSLGYGLFCTAWLHVLRRERQAAIESARTLIQLCTDHGNPNLLPFGTATLGWAFIEQGEAAQGRGYLDQGLTALHTMGTKINQPTLFAWLAAVCQQEGRPKEGLRLLAEGLGIIDETEERWFEAELYRLKGELTGLTH